MAAIDFPNSPTVGQVFTSNGKSWTWDGYTWNATQVRTAVSTVSDTAPASPVTGDEWFNSSEGRTYIYYDGQWVESSPSIKGDPGAAGRYSTGDTPPLSPVVGDTWFNTLNGKQYVYYDAYWVEPNSNLAGITGNTGATGPSAYPNLVINGAFDIWQRGTSFNDAVNGSSVFSADRWQYVRDAAVSGITVSRQAAGLTGFQYCARIQRNSGDTGANQFRFGTAFESVNSIPYAGKTVTLSFYARLGADWTGGIGVNLYSGTGTDQPITWNEFTNTGVVVSANPVASTAWQRFSYTGVVPTNATQLGVRFWGTNITGTAGANAYFEITGVQVEEGSTATSFRRAGGDIQGELAKCQRYFQRIGGTGGYVLIGTGQCESATAARTSIRLPVTLRTAPSLSRNSDTLFVMANSTGTFYTTTSVQFNGAYYDGFQLYTVIGSSVLTAGNATTIWGYTGTIDISSEIT